MTVCIAAVTACGGTDGVGLQDTGSVAGARGTVENGLPGESAVERVTPEAGLYRGSYEVPVPDELAAYAEYEIDPIELRLRESEIELRYRMPALLIGEAQEVSFRGGANAAGEYALQGDYGSATCAARAGVFRCDEVLRDMEPDFDKIAEALSSLSAPEANGRRAVTDRFAVDPIGVLSFDMTP